MTFTTRKAAYDHWYDQGLDLEYSHGAKIVPQGDLFVLMCLQNGEFVVYTA